MGQTSWLTTPAGQSTGLAQCVCKNLKNIEFCFNLMLFGQKATNFTIIYHLSFRNVNLRPRFATFCGKGVIFILEIYLQFVIFSLHWRAFLFLRCFLNTLVSSIYCWGPKFDTVKRKIIPLSSFTSELRFGCITHTTLTQFYLPKILFLEYSRVIKTVRNK